MKLADKTMGQLEKEKGMKFGVNPRMKLKTFLKRNGQPSLAKLLSYTPKKKR